MIRRRRRLVALGIFLIIFVFLSISVTVSRPLKGVVGQVFAPVMKVVAAIGRKFGQIWTVTFHSDNVVSEKSRLEDEVNKLRFEKKDLEEQLRGMRSLEEQLSSIKGWLEEMGRWSEEFTLVHRDDFELLPAHIIGWDPEIWYSTVLINRGSRDGIGRGSLVVEGDKLVGRVIEVRSGWSRVRLLTDHSSVVPAMVMRKGDGGGNGSAEALVRGIVVTTEKRELKLDYLADVKGISVGDSVVTSEANHRYEEERIVFPPGLKIGTITLINAETGASFSAMVEPAADFRNLEKVYVIVVK